MNKPSLLQKTTPEPPETGGRITNETVAEHRERILAGGRKFKYPLQYTRRRVLVISILILLVAVVSFSAFAAWQLYNVQNVGSFMYRLTRIIPFPVAQAEGEFVRYSDYLRELRSSIHYFSTKEAVNFKSDDGKRQLEYQKRLALDKAIDNTIVKKIAKQEGVGVTNQEVNDFVKKQVSGNRLGLTEQSYEQIIRSYYDWSLEEYKESIRVQLLRKKVAAKIDTAERQKAEAILQALLSGKDFAIAAKESSEDPNSRENGGDLGVLSIDSTDANIVGTAVQMQPGSFSGVVEGGDGFYIVKLLEKPNDKEVRVAVIFISYKALSVKIEEIRQGGIVQEFIEVEPIAKPSS
ncbi:MAG TPA: peptidylprolyl isomerase [Candidatus Saccharimonadales bacterium]|nr:peptidylprolyl isomerase [Candidatus Saccharimonadales bacterium]